MDLKIVATDDGSVTLYRPDIDETFHSRKGALTESRHVFIECGLLHRHAAEPSGEIPLRLLEVGFGTGLNAMLALEAAREGGFAVDYHGVELYPLSEEQLRATGYDSEAGIGADIWEAVVSAPWDTRTAVAGSTFTKVTGDVGLWLNDMLSFDVIFMDAFSPEKEPGLWTPEFLGRLAAALAPGGCLTTYCAKGCVRRALAAAGLSVERLPGPPRGKREILRGVRNL